MAATTNAIVGGLLITASLATSSAAAAGTPGPTESLGKSKGLEYMRAKHGNVIDQVGQSAYCDADDEVTGGGGVINGSAAGTALHETYPDVGDLSGWRSEASTAGDEPRRLTTFAICGGLPVSYGSTQSALGTDVVLSQPDACPNATLATGGGMSATGAGVKLVGSLALPQGSPGWLATAWNDTASDTLMDTHSVCTTFSNIRYRSSELTKLNAGETDKVTAKCRPKEAVLGGGFVGTNGVDGVRTVALATKPWDSKADGNKVPDDGWRARAYNAQTSQVNFEAQAVCQHRPPSAR